MQQRECEQGQRALEEGNSISKGPEMRNNLFRAGLRKKFKLTCVKFSETGDEAMFQL